MVREICRDEVFLAQKAEAATEADLLVPEDLLETMIAHKDGCVGMAANMIGVNKRIIAFDNDGAHIVMFNPEIVKKSGRYNAEEGCLSLPGTRKAKRWKSIKVRYQNPAFQERFLGEPGKINTTYKNGYRRDTKIGKNGRAVKERHYTDHGRPDKHTNPHDHKINWEPPRYGQPNFEKPHINYLDGAPEFRSYGRTKQMGKIIQANTPEQDRFITISNFKDCMIRGGEVMFIWNSIKYAITHPEGKINISIVYKPETEKWCDTADEVLEYMVGSDRLRDVITQVTVIDRTI